MDLQPQEAPLPKKKQPRKKYNNKDLAAQIKGNVYKAKHWAADSKHDPYEVYKEYYGGIPKNVTDGRNAIRKQIGYTPKQMSSFLRTQAMNKFITKLRATGNFENLSNQDIELLVIEDDLGDIWNGMKKAGSQLWSAAVNNPSIVNTVKSLGHSGIRAISALVPELAPVTMVADGLLDSGVDWLTAKGQSSHVSTNITPGSLRQSNNLPWSMISPAPISNTMLYPGSTDVNMQYVFGALSPNHTVVAHPEDNPEYIYTAQQSVQFNLIPNASGNAAFKISPYSIYTTAAAGDGYYYTNTVTGYIPSSNTATGTWVGVNGPQQTNISLFNCVRLIKTVVQIIPTAAMTNASGSLTCGVLVTPTQTGGDTPETLVIGLSNLTNIPYTETTNMLESQTKTIFCELIEGDQWCSASTSPFGNAGLTNVVYGICSGCVGGSFTIRITYGWGAKLTSAGLAFATPKQPDFGNYTNQFLDFLRKRYPDIQNWSVDHIDKLISMLRNVSSANYDVLVRACQGYDSGYQTRRGPIAHSGTMSIDEF